VTATPLRGLSQHRRLDRLGWLDERRRLRGTSINEVMEHAQQRRGASGDAVMRL
jgi:cyclic beta-1,2-glucan synthetase